jgi:hypothetical protein
VENVKRVLKNLCNPSTTLYPCSFVQTVVTCNSDHSWSVEKVFYGYVTLIWKWATLNSRRYFPYTRTVVQHTHDQMPFANETKYGIILKWIYSWTQSHLVPAKSHTCCTPDNWKWEEDTRSLMTYWLSVRICSSAAAVRITHEHGNWTNQPF